MNTKKIFLFVAACLCIAYNFLKVKKVLAKVTET